jgi:hypothetical protein
MQIMTQGRPSRASRAKRSIGKKQALLHNVVFNETDKKAKRLFELIKKLYQMPEEDDDSYLDDDMIRNNKAMKRNKNIPNILHLVGTIFGTEEDEKDNNNNKMFLHEVDNEMNELKFFKDKRSKRNTVFLGKRLNMDKIRKTSPFIISISNKNKLINKNAINSSTNNNNNLITNNISNEPNNNINTMMNNINTTNNLISKEDDFSTNRILSEIRSEISRGGKNLIRFTNCSVHLNYQNKDEANANNTKDKNEKKNNNLIDNTYDTINENIVKDNNSNNTGKNNNNNNKNNSKIPFISNISVTINQFFDKFKSSQKKESQNSERRNMNNSNETNNDKNDINDIDKKENVIEEKIRDNGCLIKSKTTMHKIPLNRKEREEMNINNDNPINNIINIVLRNDNNNNNNNDNNNNTNDNEEEGVNEREAHGRDIFFNKFFNDNKK